MKQMKKAIHTLVRETRCKLTTTILCAARSSSRTAAQIRTAAQEATSPSAVPIRFLSPSASPRIQPAVLSPQRAVDRPFSPVRSRCALYDSDVYVAADGNILKKVPDANDGRYEATKQSHVDVFFRLLSAPAGFYLADWPYMYKFHAMVVDGELLTFENPVWLGFAEQFLLTLPVRSRPCAVFCTTPHTPSQCCAARCTCATSVRRSNSRLNPFTHTHPYIPLHLCHCVR